MYWAKYIVTSREGSHAVIRGFFSPFLRRSLEIHVESISFAIVNLLLIPVVYFLTSDTRTKNIRR